MARQILRVHMSSNTSGTSVEHIEMVEWIDDGMIDKHIDARGVVAIRVATGTAHYTIGSDGSRATVEHFASNGRDFIRTTANASKLDNLLSLPRF